MKDIDPINLPSGFYRINQTIWYIGKKCRVISSPHVDLIGTDNLSRNSLVRGPWIRLTEEEKAQVL